MRVVQVLHQTCLALGKHQVVQPQAEQAWGKACHHLWQAQTRVHSAWGQPRIALLGAETRLRLEDGTDDVVDCQLGHSVLSTISFNYG